MASNRIRVSKACAREITLFAKTARSEKSSEISGYGLACEVNSDCYVYWAWPEPHSAHGAAHAEIDKVEADAMLRRLYQVQIEERGKRDSGQEYNKRWVNAYEDLHAWWHQHPPSGPNGFSGTDEETIRKDLKWMPGGWVVGLLTNGEWIKARLQLYKPFDGIYLPMDDVTVVDDVETPFICSNCREVKVRGDESKWVDGVCKTCGDSIMDRVKGEVERCLPKPVVDQRQMAFSGYDNWAEDYAAENRSFFGRTFNFDKSRVDKLTKESDPPVWHRWCNYKGGKRGKGCKNQPVLITEFGTQWCETCAKQMRILDNHGKPINERTVVFTRKAGENGSDTQQQLPNGSHD